MILACSTDRDPNSLFAPESGTLVVDAVMRVGELFPVVRVSETVAANATYDPMAAAVSGATVWIIGAADTVQYFEDGQEYAPIFGSAVRPSTRYTLEVFTADGRTVRATTITPVRLRVNRWVLLDNTGTRVLRDLNRFDFTAPENQIVYTDGLIEAWFDQGTEPGYIVGLFSRSPNSPLLIDTDLIDEADLSRDSSSPPIDTDDGTLRLPWLAIWYEGRYEFQLHRADRNWYDYARSAPIPGANFGFGGSAGDDFEQPIFHVDGGIGLFGSMASDAIQVNILPRP